MTGGNIDQSEHSSEENISIPGEELKRAQEVLNAILKRAYFDSKEYQMAMQNTFETRARVRSVLGSFLLDHPIGKSLVGAGVFTHPIIKEKELQERKIQELTEQIEETSTNMGSAEAELFARLEPDFQPRTPEEVILETVIDRYAWLRAIRRSDYDPNRHIDYRFGFTLPHTKHENSEGLNTLFPKVLFERKMAHIRDRLFTLLCNKDWEGFLELLLAHHKDPQIGEKLKGYVYDKREYIFFNTHFRRKLFRKMMSVLITEGEREFNEFDRFWQDVRLEFSDREEKKQLSKAVFPLDEWYQLAGENYHRYLYLQNFLSSYGIYP